jgi:hypothetical protein
LKHLKQYPLDVWECDGFCASWGHHNEIDFLIAVTETLGIHPKTGIVVGHRYARVGFTGEGTDRAIFHVDGPGRGVRPITEIYL